MTLIAKLLASFFWAIVVGLLAKRKNLNYWAWGIAGAASWFFALVFLAFQPYRCAKCNRVIDKDRKTGKECYTCAAGVSRKGYVEPGATLVDIVAKPTPVIPEPSIFQTILLPVLVIGALATALILAFKPNELSGIDQKPAKTTSKDNESETARTQTPKPANAALSPDMKQTIFMASPQIGSPCKVMPNIHTVNDGVKYFLMKYGKESSLISNRRIENTGQTVAIIELPTEDSSALFTLMNGTLKQCRELFALTALKMKDQKHLTNDSKLEEWVRVGSTLDGARTDYVDASSIIKDDNGLIRLTVKQLFSSPQISPKGSEFFEARVGLVLNCTENASAVFFINQYDRNTALVDHIESDKLQWAITPETDSSLRGSLLRGNCKQRDLRP
jgi:hypothetical protein